VCFSTRADSVPSFRYYLATSRELKRLDAVSRSPIFAWFSESLAGLSTIRAFHQQAIFVQNNQHRIDRNQICYLPSISVNRWLAVRLEFVGALIILTVTVLAMVALITTGVDAGLVGLVLSYALNTTSSLVRPFLFFRYPRALLICFTRIGWFDRRAKLNKTLSAWNVYYIKLRLNLKLRMNCQMRNPRLSGHRKALLNSGRTLVFIMRITSHPVRSAVIIPLDTALSWI
jgi:hypothetical protein